MCCPAGKLPLVFPGLVWLFFFFLFAVCLSSWDQAAFLDYLDSVASSSLPTGGDCYPGPNPRAVAGSTLVGVSCALLPHVLR